MIFMACYPDEIAALPEPAPDSDPGVAHNVSYGPWEEEASYFQPLLQYSGYTTSRKELLLGSVPRFLNRLEG